MNLYFKPTACAVGCALTSMALVGPSQAQLEPSQAQIEPSQAQIEPSQAQIEPSQVRTSNFQFARFLEFGATATDNPELELDPDDSELVWTVKPSVELKFTGSRIGVTAVGEFEYFRFTRQDDDIVDPRFFARARGTLLDNFLFADGTIVYSKLAPDSNFLRLSQDNDTAASTKGRLFIDRSFGQFADLYVEYNNNTFFDSVRSEVSSIRNGAEVFLGRNPQYGGIFWELGGNYVHDESTDNLFENSSLYGSIGATLSKTLLTKLTVGAENRRFVNDIDSNNPITTEDDQSSLWDANVTWSPSERTQLSAGFGHRFFGSGPSLGFRHRTENSNILASFTRDISRSAATLDSISVLSDTTGTSLPSDTGTVNVENSNLAAELDEPFVDNRFQLSYKLAGRRSDVIVDLVYSLQEPLTGDDDIESWLGRLIFDRKLSELTTLRLQYDYRTSDAPNRENLTYEENRIGIKLIFNFDRIEPTRDEEFSE